MRNTIILAKTNGSVYQESRMKTMFLTALTDKQLVFKLRFCSTCIVFSKVGLVLQECLCGLMPFIRQFGEMKTSRPLLKHLSSHSDSTWPQRGAVACSVTATMKREKIQHGRSLSTCSTLVHLKRTPATCLCIHKSTAAGTAGVKN